MNTSSLRFACDDSYRSRTSEIPIAQDLLEVIPVDFDVDEIIIRQRGVDSRQGTESHLGTDALSYKMVVLREKIVVFYDNIAIL